MYTICNTLVLQSDAYHADMTLQTVYNRRIHEHDERLEKLELNMLNTELITEKIQDIFRNGTKNAPGDQNIIDTNIRLVYVYVL